jgi:hypothetical protein
MKNQYEVSEDGKTVTIWLNRKGVRWGCKIDAEDLPKVDGMPNTWHAQWNETARTYYATNVRRVNGKKVYLKMHRFITDAKPGQEVDHGNHEGLDNRRENLRLVTRSGNMMNRRGAASNSGTGHRGVSPYPRYGKFVLRVTIDGKRKFKGYFSTIDEAIAARNQYPEYARSA